MEWESSLGLERGGIPVFTPSDLSLFARDAFLLGGMQILSWNDYNQTNSSSRDGLVNGGLCFGIGRLGITAISP
jgi:hypothetical protein